jgi:hypothetical protein
MHRIIKMAAIIGVVSVMGAGSAWAGRVGDRQHWQKNRIRQGVQSGELTRKEVRVLVKEQRRIQKFKSFARSDGRITPKERWKLERLQDQANHRIYRFKHNTYDRW